MSDRSKELREQARAGGQRYLAKLREQNKLTVRERLDLLLDPGSLVEDGLFANALAEDLPADGVVTGLGTIEGRQVACRSTYAVAFILFVDRSSSVRL